MHPLSHKSKCQLPDRKHVVLKNGGAPERERRHFPGLRKNASKLLWWSPPLPVSTGTIHSVLTNLGNTSFILSVSLLITLYFGHFVPQRLSLIRSCCCQTQKLMLTTIPKQGDGRSSRNVESIGSSIQSSPAPCR